MSDITALSKKPLEAALDLYSAALSLDDAHDKERNILLPLIQMAASILYNIAGSLDMAGGSAPICDASFAKVITPNVRVRTRDDLLMLSRLISDYEDEAQAFEAYINKCVSVGDQTMHPNWRTP